ncbi:hypothetical protein FLONG3_1324 [Fusarium longipes]|uniref:Uncharacterized protein n=1 Tax=Fusarium longipes TaxID=694270 RepID=A0A395T8P5_9HYPO|nr:hypothetical protein FLONG3_1324 [Fusarium longipes]
MRSNVLLLAVGFFVADSALAGPCKPLTSATDAGPSTSVDSATQSDTTTQETSALTTSETLFESITTTTVPDITTATSIDSQTTATTYATITTSETETTTSAEAITTVSEAETTTTAPVATPTFSIVGGGGSINGAPLKGVDQDGSTMLFNPEAGTSRPRTFILDPTTGRLKDKDTGIFVCAYYGDASSPSDPANIAFCQSHNTGPNTAYDYLTCQIASGKLVCTAPKASCPVDDDGLPLGCSTAPTSDLNNQFYYRYQQGAGDYLFISSGNPGGYTSVDIIAQES